MKADTILEVDGLKISFEAYGEKTIAVQDVSFTLKKDETLGIVGESGSGKSISSLAIMGLIPSPPGKVEHGEIAYDEVMLSDLKNDDWRKYRGGDIAMIFQEPMTSLNPSHRCGHQVDEMLSLHTDLNKRERKERVLSLFGKVKLPDPQRAYDAYPHELSGGQLQRIMIAMAISCNPKILIADEPTTALDVTVQKDILELLAELKQEFGNSIIFITHDLGVVKAITDRVIVMNKGEIVEHGSTERVFSDPQHRYTQGLLACRPPMDRRMDRLPTVQSIMNVENGDIAGFIKSLEEKPGEHHAKMESLTHAEVILEAIDIKKYYPNKSTFWGRPTSYVKAVDGVSFALRKGETLGLVGESGCGKSTLAKVLMRLIPATEGKVVFDGKDIFSLSDAEMRRLRKDYQIIFQDPYSSLNPRMKIGSAILEPMKVHGLYQDDRVRKEQVIELLEKVGLQADHFHRYPHQFSGGQRQRICIARALGLKPKFILCDESVSALDVSVQAQVLNLLKDLKEEYNLSYIFISHDLSVIKFISDRVMVMQSGKIVESGDVEQVIHDPSMDYTKQLIEAVL